MHHLIGSLLIGAVLGATSRQRLRPYLRKAVKGGIAVGRKAQAITESVRKEANVLVEEARTELDTERSGAAE